MRYEYEAQARTEAADYALSAERLSELHKFVDAKRRRFGDESVAAHCVRYDPEKWTGLIPAPLAGRDLISRGDIFRLAEAGDVTAVFAASVLWGTGRRGPAPLRS